MLLCEKINRSPFCKICLIFLVVNHSATGIQTYSTARSDTNANTTTNVHYNRKKTVFLEAVEADFFVSMVLMKFYS